ncbi:MAG: NADH-ubiquinone oxidoreductase-F iron-sulfur binding region domain-containing protein [Syntrophobacterales bacterium]
MESQVPNFCRNNEQRACITICEPSGTCSCDCHEVRRVLEKEIAAMNLGLTVGTMKVGCNGDCPYGVLVGFPQRGFFYEKVDGELAKEVVSGTLAQGYILFDLLHIDPLKATSGKILYDRSGFIATIDDSYCMVKVAQYFLQFEEGVSCGKCVPCRVGSLELREILERIIQGKGEPEDLQRLDLVCRAMQDAPYCDFARTTSDPVVAILKYFRSEFEKHVDQKVCPAGVCEGLAKEAKEEKTEQEGEE